MKYKMIAIDLDGTLLDDNKEIPKLNKAVIQQAIRKGIKVVFVTGRSRLNTVPIVTQLDLRGEDTHIISNCGATKFIPQQKLMWLDTLDLPVCGSNAVTKYANYKYYEQLQRKVIEDKLWDNGLQIIPRFTGTKVLSLVVNPKSKGETQVLESILNEHFTVYSAQYGDEQYCIDIVEQGTNKGDTLLQYAKSYNIAPHEIVAFGDGNNDVPMLQKVGLGIAMGNAPIEVKRLADGVCDINNKAGLGKAIYSIIQQQK